jgi:ribosomal protein L7/L12
MTFDDLPNDVADRIVFSGIELMSAITDAFGAEEGIEVWNKMAEHIGQEFHQRVFMAMLSGQTSCHVRLIGKGVRDNGYFVELIKTIRNYTGLGLKEAKDIADGINNGATETIKLMKSVDRRPFLEAIKKTGVTAF